MHIAGRVCCAGANDRTDARGCADEHTVSADEYTGANEHTGSADEHGCARGDIHAGSANEYAGADDRADEGTNESTDKSNDTRASTNHEAGCWFACTSVVEAVDVAEINATGFGYSNGCGRIPRSDEE